MSDWIGEIRPLVGTRMLPVVSSVGWIEDQTGRVLLQKRSPIQESWGFPGGILELGESASQTVTREIHEETGLDCSVEALIGVYSKYFLTCPNGDECQTISFFFKAQIVGGQLGFDGCDETFGLKFIAPERVGALWCDQHNDMLADAKTGQTGFIR